MRQGRQPERNPGFVPDVAGLSRPQTVFFVLAETPCPYLAGRRERKLITEIDGFDATRLYSALSRAGFRRSHQFAYRPACDGCAACVPVRVVVDGVHLTRSLGRVWRANADLTAVQAPARATAEQYDLFDRYIRSRHGDGEMAGMTFSDYRGMVEHSRIDTRMVEFRDSRRRLVAACLTDWLDDGSSAVYSFFDPALSRRSLGTYMVLWLIMAARARGLPYTYLGYWIAGSPKMAYKTRFRPLEALGPDGWTVLCG
ncbi:MAG: arginyltransferase [Alphaproteobacteria bacterium]|nr:MAG: arginyltransferase [Alphaproteobacteria bacterium]